MTAISLALMYWQMSGVIEAFNIEIDVDSANGVSVKKVQTVFELKEALGDKGSSVVDSVYCYVLITRSFFHVSTHLCA